MKDFLARRLYRSHSRGGVLVLVAFLLIGLLAIAALSIDIGYITTTKNELQNVADAAALAGAGRLGEIYSGAAVAAYDHSVDYPSIALAATTVAQNNKAAGLAVSIAQSDIRIGQWDNDTRTFTAFDPANPVIPTAVQVRARRDAGSNGPITSLFAGVIGIDSFDVEADAIASLSGPSWVAEGELITPFALSENLFPYDCRDLIEFSPTTTSCAAWHNFFDRINASAMEAKLWGFIEGDEDQTGSCEHCEDCQHCDGTHTLINGSSWLATNFEIVPGQYPAPAVTPAAESGDSFYFQGGDIGSLFLGGYLGPDYDTGSNIGNTGTILDNIKKPAPIVAMFDYFRYRDGDGDDSVWTATIPIYKDDTVQDPSTPGAECDNANQQREIVGFAKIVVMNTDPPPDRSVSAHVDCNFSTVDGRGGGGTFGNLLGTIPNLVE